MWIYVKSIKALKTKLFLLYTSKVLICHSGQITPITKISVNVPWVSKRCVWGNTTTLRGKEAKYFNVGSGGTHSEHENLKD